MGRPITKYFLLITCLLSSCTERVTRCDLLCAGHEWYVKDCVMAPYPRMIPFEKNDVIVVLEEELNCWKIKNLDTLVTQGKSGKEIMFKYRVVGDTIIFLTGRRDQIELIIRERSENKLQLELIGLFRAKIYLQRQE